MAEVVAGLITSPLVQIASDKLSAAIAEQAGLVCNFGKDLEGMKDTMESMAAVLEDAEQQSVKNKSVRLWLKRLKDAALDISDMMDDYHDTAKRPGMFSCLKTARKKMVLANKMKNMREKLEKIYKERQNFTLAPTSGASQDQQLYDERETRSDVKEAEILGRGGEKKDITEFLSSSHSKDGGVMVLPIYGLGGSGKSTLAKLVYNDTQFEQYYDHRVWVYVSQVFDLYKIGRSIISQLSTDRDQQNLFTLQEIQKRLNVLFRGKNILIILDDIWEEDDSKLKDLKDMLDKKPSMVDVIVTTRSESIANKICTNKAYRLQPLEDNICWDIIKRFSGFEHKNNKEKLEQIGLDIAKKCGGLALAAQAIGYTLKSKDLHGWSEMNNSDIWNVPSEVDNSQHKKVLPSLKLSYEWMPSILRLCFSYCAIFPKGHDIYEDDLVHQWVALDFIKKPSEGKEYIKQLLGMSFLQHSKLYSEFQLVRYTMHDLVHDLARSVIGDELIVIDAAKMSHNTSQPKYCRYAVLTNYDGQTKLSNILPKKVRALHFSSSSKLDHHDGSFSFAKCLRILDFCECSGIILPSSIGQLNQLRCLLAPKLQNERLPESIAELSKLQCLSLRGSSHMCALPESIGKLSGRIHLCLSSCSSIKKVTESIGRLQNLMHLDVSHSSGITVRPESLGELKSLVHLDMSCCSKITVLPESLGELKSLVHLDMSCCSKITVLPESLGELKSLVHLDMSWCSEITVLPESLGELKSLVHLDMSFSEITVLPESLGGLKSLVHLNMSCSEITVLPESLGGLKNLVHLDMLHCSRITVLPESLGALKSLVHLNMLNCHRITALPESCGELKSLMHLNLSDCHRITVLPESFGGLKSLVHLDMSRCYRITVLPESFGGLKSLVHLDMSRCYRITVLPESLGGLKSLVHLDMSGCSDITVLPESLGELKSLQYLNLSACFGVKEIPKSLGALSQLQTLKLSKCNGIRRLPEAMGSLINLTSLDVSECENLESLPDGISEITTLKSVTGWRF